MTFSPGLEARFDKLLKSYPAGRQRAAMVPMLIYAQDEVGHCSDELIEEVAKRTGVTTLAVNEVLSYYSMLHKKPWGKFHVQICTNISCLLRDGDKLWEHACEKLGIGHQRSHGGWPDLARRGRMHRRLLLGARPFRSITISTTS